MKQSPIQLGISRHTPMQPGRNDPCPCGSGKKYKNCCIHAQQPTQPQPLPSLSAVLTQALELHQTGRLREAVDRYQAVLERSPSHEDALHLLGVCHHQLGENEAALACIEKAVGNKPKEPVFHNSLGAVLKALGQTDRAVSAFQRAVALKPAYAEALNNLGLTLKEQEKFAEAMLYLRKALVFQPNYPDALINLGQCETREKQYDQATLHFGRALALDPQSAAAWEGLGDAQMGLGHVDEALQSYLKGLQLQPASPHLHYCVAEALAQRGEQEQAVSHYQNAIQLQPDYLLAIQSLANLLYAMERYEDCIPYYQRVLTEKPDFVTGYANLGHVMKHLGQMEASAAYYRQAIALDPRQLGVYFALGLVELALGDIKNGWQHYGMALPGRNNAIRDIDAPLWNGEDLAGKSLFIASEQGVGDVIMSHTMSTELVARAGKTFVECTPKLAKLFQRSFPTATVLPRNTAREVPEEVKDVDYWVPLGNIGQWTRQSLSDFGSGNAYLAPDPERVAYWKRRYAELGDSPKVGLCWRSLLMWLGRLKHYIQLEDFLPILRTSGCIFVNLQYTDCAAEIADFEQRFGITIHRFPEVDLLNDMDEAAAVTQALDLAVSVGTAALHLAGATGIETWGILTDDNWTTMGTDHLPWYPHTRVFRYGTSQNWKDAIDQVANELDKWKTTK